MADSPSRGHSLMIMTPAKPSSTLLGEIHVGEPDSPPESTRRSILHHPRLWTESPRGLGALVFDGQDLFFANLHVDVQIFDWLEARELG